MQLSAKIDWSSFKEDKMQRRTFLKWSSLTLAALATPLLKVGRALAEAILQEDDQTAKALGYHHDATKVDPKKWAAREAGAEKFCHNCILAQGAPKEVDGQDGQWMACQLFPGKLVSAQGWCASWAKKPG